RRLATENAHALQHSLRNQGARGEAADAAMGQPARDRAAAQAAVRIRSDATDERDHGAHHHAAAARRPAPRPPLPAQTARAVRSHSQEGAGLLPQHLLRNAEPPEEPGQDLKTLPAAAFTRSKPLDTPDRDTLQATPPTFPPGNKKGP